jgi:hypothetical protein
VKTRTDTRTRLVPHTIDGHTEMVAEEYTLDVPEPPRDWDRTVLAAVTSVAALIGAASVLWSTASIGALLGLVVFPIAAYAAAAVFDLVWLSCMALEWLARYDPERARGPRRAGHGALLVAMGAVAVHGYAAGHTVVGVVGALISGLAKALWTLVLRHHALPLDDRTQQWVDKRRAAVGGQLAMVSVRRQLTRAQAQIDAERAALRMDPDANPDRSGQSADDPDPSGLPPGVTPMTIKEAVRTAVDSGITDPDAVLRYVRTRSDANAKLATVERYLRPTPKAAP